MTMSLYYLFLALASLAFLIYAMVVFALLASALIVPSEVDVRDDGRNDDNLYF